MSIYWIRPNRARYISTSLYFHMFLVSSNKILHISDGRVVSSEQSFCLLRVRLETFDLKLEVPNLLTRVAELGIQTRILFFQGLQEDV